LRNPLSPSLGLSKLFPLVLVTSISLCLSCSAKKEPAPQATPSKPDLAGEWRSDIESADRIVTTAMYRIAQSSDTIELELVSTKSPTGAELVPTLMWFRAKGAWQSGALRFAAVSWIAGRDTCTFQLRGDMDKEGRLLLHFPGDLCGEKSLPYMRRLHRPEARPQ
jgi:hypothetical protein